MDDINGGIEVEVPENSPKGTVVAMLTSSDAVDHYTITDTRVTIVAVFGSEIRINEEVVDFEDDLQRDTSVEIEATCTDGSIARKVFDLWLMDVDEKPTAIDAAPSPLVVSEELTSPMEVAVITVVDADGSRNVGPAQTHALTLNGTDAAAFYLDGNKLMCYKTLDFEQGISMLLVTVTALSQSYVDEFRGVTVAVAPNTEFTKLLSVTVINVNESPTFSPASVWV